MGGRNFTAWRIGIGSERQPPDDRRLLHSAQCIALRKVCAAGRHHGGEDHAYVLDTARDKGFSASQPMLRRCEKILSRQVVHNFFFHFLWSIFATLIR